MKAGWAFLLLGGLVGQSSLAAEIDIPGLLINDTRTFAGQEFYSAFVAAWQAYDPDGRYTLVVKERPSARTGSQMTVSTAANEVLFQRFIGFNARIAQRAGKEASSTTFNALTAAELDRQLPDPDLGTDEIR